MNNPLLTISSSVYILLEGDIVHGIVQVKA